MGSYSGDTSLRVPSQLSYTMGVPRRNESALDGRVGRCNLSRHTWQESALLPDRTKHTFLSGEVVSPWPYLRQCGARSSASG